MFIIFIHYVLEEGLEGGSEICQIINIFIYLFCDEMRKFVWYFS